MDKVGFSLNDSEFQRIHDILVNYGMPVDNFLKNIKTLRIISTKANNSKNGYNSNRNTITLTDECNLIHELFNVASYDRKNINGNLGMSFYDKNKFLRGNSLREGITDLFTSLVDPNFKSSYELEMNCAKILAYLFGMNIFKEHFNNNPSEFYLQFRFCTNRVRKIVNCLDKHQKYQETALKFSSRGKTFDYSNMKYNFHDLFDCFDKLAHILKIDEEEYKNFISELLSSSQYMIELCETMEYNVREKQM